MEAIPPQNQTLIPIIGVLDTLQVVTNLEKEKEIEREDIEKSRSRNEREI